MSSETESGRDKGHNATCPTCGAAMLTPSESGGGDRKAIGVGDLPSKHGELRVQQALNLIDELTAPRPQPANPEATLRWFLEGEGAPLVGKPVDPERRRHIVVDGCVIGAALLRSFDMDQIRAAIARQVASGDRPTHASIVTDLRAITSLEYLKARTATRGASVDGSPSDRCPRLLSASLRPSIVFSGQSCSCGSREDSSWIQERASSVDRSPSNLIESTMVDGSLGTMS